MFEYDDGYGAGNEGIFIDDNIHCPRCGSTYKHETYSVQTGRHYLNCAGCELRLKDLGTGQVFSKPYAMFGGEASTHLRGYGDIEL